MIMNRQLKENIFITLTFVIALLLMILPQPMWMMHAKPQWVFVVLIFWVMHAPRKIGPIFSWCIGLYVDLLMGDVLGEHALIYVLSTYVLQRFLRVFQAMPLWQLILAVGLAGVWNSGIQFLFVRFLDAAQLSWTLFLPAVANMVIWPWLYFLCRDVRPRHDYRLMHGR